MATETQTTLLEGLSPEMKTFYSMELLEGAKPALVHNQFGKHQPLPQGKGKKIEWRKFSNFAKATTPLVEGVTPDGHGLTVSTVEAEVAQYGDWSAVSDVLDMTAIDPIIAEYTQKHADNMGLTLDTICRNSLQQGTQVMYAPKVAEDGTETEVVSRDDLDASAKLTGKLVAKAATALKKANAPKINGKYVAIIHPSVAYDLRRDPEWLEAHKYAQPDEIFNGEIGELHGVRFVETTEAKIYKNASGLAVYGCLFMGKEPYADIELEGGNAHVIVKPKGSAGTADPLDQRSSIGWKATGYATKILYNEYIIRVEVASEYSDVDEEN